ncbi:hypothetical protein A3Q56_08705 [Intoshia linei]|uniref:Uncharacterized protein n=1 Tax=Intoshia linei TaxID=1819745 RepID=A0A177ANE9_9BILA|nr:hypothetical protein A3Q56_08705 [Intoshia linei]
MMLLLGLDSQFVGVEGLITAIDDSKFFNMRGYRRTLVTDVVCLILFICGLPRMTEGGIYIFQSLDYYSGSRIIVLIIGIIKF